MKPARVCGISAPRRSSPRNGSNVGRWAGVSTRLCGVCTAGRAGSHAGRRARNPLLGIRELLVRCLRCWLGRRGRQRRLEFCQDRRQHQRACKGLWLRGMGRPWAWQRPGWLDGLLRLFGRLRPASAGTAVSDGRFLRFGHGRLRLDGGFLRWLRLFRRCTREHRLGMLQPRQPLALGDVVIAARRNRCTARSWSPSAAR